MSAVQTADHGDEWAGCYSDGWQGEIVEESFAHPAKYSRALIRRIYDHAKAQGWVQAGSLVCDPFGGVACGALDALWNGYHWIGCALEAKFVERGRQNLARFTARYGMKEGWGAATLLQGDSRQLAQVLTEAELTVSSPPFSDMLTQTGGGIYARGEHTNTKGGQPLDYGSSSGQLGAAPPDTFWQASRTILEQCFLLLKPGGHAIFVCKDYVRNKPRVPFSDQWQALCAAVGFRLVCRHRALLVETHGEQHTLFDASEKIETSKKSFFRRLAENKGSPKIDHEDVLCCEKGGDAYA